VLSIIDKNEVKLSRINETDMDEYIKIMKVIRFSLIFFIIAMISNSCELTEDLIDINPLVSELKGEWLCDENSEIYKATKEVYMVYISPDADNPNGLIIDGFYQLGDIGLKATVLNTSISIHSQTVEGGFTISGSGIVASNHKRIDWTYNVDDGSGVIDHVTAVYTRN
jgi:hypothetical protein